MARCYCIKLLSRSVWAAGGASALNSSDLNPGVAPKPIFTAGRVIFRVGAPGCGRSEIPGHRAEFVGSGVLGAGGQDTVGRARRRARTSVSRQQSDGQMQGELSGVAEQPGG